MLPIYKTNFYKTAPKLSEEAKIEILRVARWFGEEKNTSIIVFGSIEAPQVLPYYVRDKLLTREIPYQIAGDGLTKALKEMKIYFWPTFPLQCSSFILHDYGNVTKEIENITSLKLATIAGQQFDPNKVANDFTTMVKIGHFTNEEDPFGDRF